MEEGSKRLFFGVEIHAPWPSDYPAGRMLAQEDRHITLAFLGNVNDEKIAQALPRLPSPLFEIGLSGIFDKCLFFPKRDPHVVAWHVDFGENNTLFTAYQRILAASLKEEGFHLSEHEIFTPHVTLCRRPFNREEWEQAFQPYPMYASDVNLYQSLGNNKFAKVWKWPVPAPFEEIEHTADVAFCVRGRSFHELCKHAQMSLAFRDPRILPYLHAPQEMTSLENVVESLNDLVAKIDTEIGCDFKAVSYHVPLTKSSQYTNLYEWEMIIDV